MAMCIDKSSAEYQTLKNRSGIPESTLNAVCRDFLERYGRFPYLDELPDSNSEPALKENLHIKENGGVKISDVLEATGKETIEEAVVSINDEYRDLEVTMVPIVDEAIVDITHRPTDNNFTPEEIERDNILRNSPRNEFGQLLAPNGEVSNLTEEQYVQVRTKAFKRWFGDWETANKFNFRAIDRSKVDVIPMNKPWKDNPTKFNKTIRIYLKGLHEKGYFELVKDDEFATYSVHFITATEQTGPLTSSRGEHAIPSTYNERLILWELLLNAIPDGAMISTHGNLSEDGIRALNKLGKKGRFTKIGEREVSKKGTSEKVNIPIWQKGKPTSKVVDENGEPLVVYHGTTSNFSVFKKEKLGKNTKAPSAKLAFFASSSEKMARYYSDMLTNDDIRELYHQYDSNLTDADIGIEPEENELDNLYNEEMLDIGSVYRKYSFIDNIRRTLPPKTITTTHVVDDFDIAWGEYPGKKLGDVITTESQSSYTDEDVIDHIKLYIEFYQDIKDDVTALENEINSIKEKYDSKIKEFIKLKEDYKLNHQKQVFLNIKNPKIDNDNNLGYRSERYSKRIQDAITIGNDGGIIFDTRDPFDTDVFYFFSTNQIKSATNNTGEYSRFNSNIYDEEVNDFIVLNNALEKLASLYGIQFNDITDAELQTEQWRSIMPEGSSINAFIYNGLVYINVDRAKVDTPLHEMMHMFVGSIRFTNPQLYSELVQSTESFPNYDLLASQYLGRTRNDVNEEILVTEVAKYLTGQQSNLSGIDEGIRHEILYNVKRVLDTILMGKDSVKTITDDRLFNMSLQDMANMVQSTVMHNNFSGTMNVENSELHRKLNNIKSDLYKNGTLEEYCD